MDGEGGDVDDRRMAVMLTIGGWRMADWFELISGVDIDDELQ